MIPNFLSVQLKGHEQWIDLKACVTCVGQGAVVLHRVTRIVGVALNKQISNSRARHLNGLHLVGIKQRLHKEVGLVTRVAIQHVTRITTCLTGAHVLSVADLTGAEGNVQHDQSKYAKASGSEGK